MSNVSVWGTWDWESIKKGLMVLTILCIGIYVMFIGPDWIRDYHAKSMTEKTTGKFIRSEYIKRVSQGRFGTTTETITGVLIDYSYTVNGEVYNSQDRISVSNENQLFFDHLKDSINLKINYDPDKPERSQINSNLE